VLIHELLHIPKTFSGALRPHEGSVKINERTVGELHRIYKERKKELENRRNKGISRAEEMF
jgi:predicted metallopeptidase